MKNIEASVNFSVSMMTPTHYGNYHSSCSLGGRKLPTSLAIGSYMEFRYH